MDAEQQRHRRRRLAVAAWLFVVLAMVFAMVVLGGVTRLNHAGLSMVDWKPISGWLPPGSEAEWRQAFAAYRRFPEYRELNLGMTLAEFRSIFQLEFLHRLWGRLLGVVFLLPFLAFAAWGWIGRRLGARLVAVFVLGAAQGGLGWFMVKSGLVDAPDVSQYRLAAHLGLALILFAWLLWLALEQLRPEPAGPGSRLARGAALAVAGLVFGNPEDQRIDVAAEFHQTDPRLGECTVASRQPRHHSPCRSNLALPQQHVGSPQMILFA